MGLVCPINSCIITQCAGLDGPKYTARQFSETWNTVKIKISSISHFTTNDVENDPERKQSRQYGCYTKLAVLKKNHMYYIPAH